MGEHNDATAADTPGSVVRAELASPPPVRYRILAQIGAGGMGRVFRAHDTVLGRDVAIKLIERDDLKDPDRVEHREQFVREARAAARVLHPNVAVVHDVDPDAGWLVMELVAGESLRAVQQRGPVEPALVASIAAQMFEALAAAHAAGVIHRDVKPSNIMLDAEGHAKLVDFGVARRLDVEVTRTGERVGTPAYMAPEQVRGVAVDDRTDLYGLGATLLELATGERLTAFEPPTGVLLGKLERACRGERHLAAVVVRCLQPDPNARFERARAALAALYGGPPRARTWRWIAAAAAVAAVAAITGSVIPLGSHARDRDPRLDQAFVVAQRGEDGKALQILAGYTAEHRDDPDAATIVLLATWWQGNTIDEVKRRATELPLRPAQRAMIEGIDLITQRRDSEAIAFLENAARETPDQVEIEYALGEARWHGQHLEDGATTLADAFARDPRWEMALHHVIEYRLSRGEVATMQPIADKLRALDPSSAAVLDCEVAISDRAYPRATSGARAALARKDFDKIPELYVCLAQALVLGGDVDGGAAAAKTAFELWPLETRDRGGFPQYAEFFLYRGQLDAYLELMRGKPSTQRAIALLLQRPTAEVDEPKPAWPASRMPPLGAATWILQQHVHGIDAASVYATYPEPEVRAWGLALEAESHGDRAAAIAQLRTALTVPAKGDIRMLVAHELAKLLRDNGDQAAAAEACDEVIRPRFYMNYRAVLLPDCVAWTSAK